MQESATSVHPELGEMPFETRNQSGNGSPRVSQRHFAKVEKAVRSILTPHSEQTPPYAIWISGESGVGKSTLISSVRSALHEEQLVFVEGKAYPNTSEVLEPILVAARRLVQQVMNRVRQDEPGWEALWDQIVARHAPALDRVLPEVDWGHEVKPFPDLDPQFERGRLLDHLAGLFTRVAEKVPTLIYIENADLLDPLGVDFLKALGRVCRARWEGRNAGLPLPEAPRLGVILTTDSEEAPPLPLAEPMLLHIVMRGLGRDDFARVLRHEYGEDVPLSIREKLYQKTQGNPIDLDLRLRLERMEWTSKGGPDSVMQRSKRLLEYRGYEAQLADEMRGLGAQQRSALQALAVLEKPISVSILGRLLKVDDDSVCGVLEQLESYGWVQHTRGAVGLSHDRVRAPVLDSLGAKERLALHRQCATLIRSEYEKRPYRRFQEVYYHYANGPRDRETVEAGFLAAEEASRLCDYEGAVDIYSALLDMVEDDDRDLLLRALTQLADLLVDHKGPTSEPLLDQLEQLVYVLQRDLDGEEAAGLWRRLGSIAGKWGLQERELNGYRRGLEALEGLGKTTERMLIFACIARSTMAQRRFDETLEYCREALDGAVWDELTNDPEYLELCRVTEEVHFRRGDFVEAIAFEERCLQLARQQGAPQGIFTSLLRLAYLHEHRGDTAAAQSCLDEALPVARSTGSRVLQANIDERIGYLNARLEKWPAATAAFRRALEAEAEIGNERRTVRTLGALGMVSLITGEVRTGATYFRLYALHQGLRERTHVPQQVPGFPNDYRSRSERDEEVRARMETVARASKVPTRVLVDALSELADLRRDRGEYQLARATLRRGLRIAESERLDPVRFHLQLGILHQQQGDIESALVDLQRGLNAMSSYPDRERVAEVNVQVGILQLNCSQHQRALTSILRGLRTYLELEHETGVTHAMLHLADAYHRLGCINEAEEIAQAGLALAGTLGVDRLEAEAWLLLAGIRGPQLSAAPGHQEVGLAREMFGKLGILEGRCRALLVEAEIFLRWGDGSRAQGACAEALDIARDLGLRPQMAQALAVRGAIEGDPRVRGDFLKALKTLESALEHAEQVGARSLLLRVHGIMADLYHQRNRPGVAREHLVEVRRTLDAVLVDCPREFRNTLADSCEASSLLRLYEVQGV
ncbi:MAG: AAA family ATPase [Planctomycetota bacterium]